MGLSELLTVGKQIYGARHLRPQNLSFFKKNMGEQLSSLKQVNSSATLPHSVWSAKARPPEFGIVK